MHVLMPTSVQQLTVSASQRSIWASGIWILLLCLSGGRLSAQCDRTGWVASVTPGCGAKIIDLDSGELLKAVTGADALLGGQTIRFSTQSTALPAACTADGLKVVALTCVSDTLPCRAQFGHSVSPLNSYRISFEADIYDPSSQFCFWTFGDGATATGQLVQHTFPNEGYFAVCLTVTDAHGCSTKRCRNILVSDQNPNWCDYDVQVTAVGTKLYGKIVAISSAPGTLNSIRWFDNKTNQVLAETPEFTTTLPGEGVYNICAQYEVASADGSLCTTTRCQPLTVATLSCVNPAMMNTSAVCPSVFVPVCGCNGVTYINECAAMAAGVSKYWAGECGVASSGTCSTDLEYEIVSGAPGHKYAVKFHNLASGDYSAVQLDFGDGTSVWQGGLNDSICTHEYAKGGVYRANLTVWKNNNCVSSVSKIVVTDAYNMTADNAPTGTDYVMPGDANGDKRANVYDLLSLGLGFSATGSPRPFATTAWAPQFAPAWLNHSLDGINFKHLDCDGNGTVNEFDRNAIEQHYSPIDTTRSTLAGNAPDVWVKFAVDTIKINANNPMPLQIGADIMVGKSTQPVFGLYGLAFALRYPEYMNHDPEIYVGANSFFGFPTDILLLPKDNYDRRQYDLGFSRKYGQGVSGYGSIAKLNFTTDIIIIIDVIERGGSTIIPVTVPALGIRAYDATGKEMALGGQVQDTLWVKLEETTTTQGNAIESQVLLFPNPATEAAILLTGDLHVEQIEVFNKLGQRVRGIEPSGNRTTRFETQSWPKGLYTIRIQTREGTVTKRLLVQ